GLGDEICGGDGQQEDETSDGGQRRTHGHLAGGQADARWYPGARVSDGRAAGRLFPAVTTARGADANARPRWVYFTFLQARSNLSRPSAMSASDIRSCGAIRMTCPFSPPVPISNRSSFAASSNAAAFLGDGSLVLR